MTAFDNAFDALMDEADRLIQDTFGIYVSVNGSEKVKAIYEEKLNEFDAMSGVARHLSFRKSSGIKPRRGDQIVIVSSGYKYSVTSGPFSSDDYWVVIL